MSEVKSESLPWYKEINKTQWRALLASGMGWALDAMDVMLYSMVIVALMKELNINTKTGGLLASFTLLSSALGGIIFGMLADRIGRTKALMGSILIYSIFTGACGLSQTVTQLAIFRILLGLGMGGEWVSGAALITESWPAKHRGKAMGFVQSCWAIGYALAALITAIVMPHYGWRGVFFAGILPALATLWIRYNTEEPTIWVEEKKKASQEKRITGSLAGLAEIFRGKYLRLTLTTSFLSICAMFAYWGLFTWIPGYLSMPVEKGGAGLNILKSSTWVIAVQAGAWLGYVTYGFIADKFGRRLSFVLYFLAAAALVLAYGNIRDPNTLLLIGPFVGFFGSGYFSGFGAVLAELYPTHVRATAQGFIYNIGRGLSAFAPFIVGALAVKWGIGAALGITSLAFVLGAFTTIFVPETKGKELA